MPRQKQNHKRQRNNHLLKLRDPHSSRPSTAAAHFKLLLRTSRCSRVCQTLFESRARLLATPPLNPQLQPRQTNYICAHPPSLLLPRTPSTASSPESRRRDALLHSQRSLQTTRREPITDHAQREPSRASYPDVRPKMPTGQGTAPQ